MDNLDAELARQLRIVLEKIARSLEERAGNSTYQQAWRIAAKVVRENKPA